MTFKQNKTLLRMRRVTRDSKNIIFKKITHCHVSRDSRDSENMILNKITHCHKCHVTGVTVKI